MSLKHFHIFFIVLSIILSGGVAYWGIHDYSQNQGVSELWLGITSGIIGVGLIVYLIYFLKKSASLKSL